MVEALRDLFPDSAHVQTVGLSSASDAIIWDYARDNGFIVLTKDADFSDQSALQGHPPKVIWLRLGNTTTETIEATLRLHFEQIEAFVQDASLGVLTIFNT